MLNRQNESKKKSFVNGISTITLMPQGKQTGFAELLQLNFKNFSIQLQKQFLQITQKIKPTLSGFDAFGGLN